MLKVLEGKETKAVLGPSSVTLTDSSLCSALMLVFEEGIPVVVVGGHLGLLSQAPKQVLRLLDALAPHPACPSAVLLILLSFSFSPSSQPLSTWPPGPSSAPPPLPDTSVRANLNSHAPSLINPALIKAHHHFPASQARILGVPLILPVSNPSPTSPHLA